MSFAIGTTFDNFTVTGPADSKNGHAYVRVTCSCGAPERIVRASYLRLGKVSCACRIASRRQRAVQARRDAAAQEVSDIQVTAKAVQSLQATVVDLVYADLTDLRAELVDKVEDAAMRLARQSERQERMEKRLDGIEQQQTRIEQKLDDLLDLIKAQIVGTVQACAATEDEQPQPQPQPQPQTGLPLPGNPKLADIKVALYGDVQGSARLPILARSNERLGRLAETPFDERTQDLKEELRQRWMVLCDRIDYLLPSDAEWQPLAELRHKGKRAMDVWEHDPKND
jgi:hypothetical protein